MSETASKMPKEKYKNVFDIINEKMGVELRMSKKYENWPCENEDEECNGIMIELTKEEAGGSAKYGRNFSCNKCCYNIISFNNWGRKQIAKEIPGFFENTYCLAEKYCQNK